MQLIVMRLIGRSSRCFLFSLGSRSWQDGCMRPHSVISGSVDTSKAQHLGRRQLIVIVGERGVHGSARLSAPLLLFVLRRIVRLGLVAQGFFHANVPGWQRSTPRVLRCVCVCSCVYVYVCVKPVFGRHVSRTSESARATSFRNHGAFAFGACA